MQTTKFIYLIMWAIFIAPLIAFNIKRMSEKKYGEKRKIKWAFVSFIVCLTVLISAFLGYAYKVTVDTRYELAAERYIDLHAEYLTGKLTYDAYIAKSTPLLTSDADVTALTEDLSAKQGTVKDSVRFQISSWIIPKYYKDDENFPKTQVIDSENPVFVVYLIDEGSPETVSDDAATQFYYLTEMVWSDNGGWKIAYDAPATDAQLTSAKSSLPSQINGKWFAVTS